MRLNTWQMCRGFYLNLSSLLWSTQTLWLSLSLAYFLLLPFFLLTLCQFVALKPVCSLTVHFRFPVFQIFGSPASVHLNPSILHNQSLYNTSQGSGHLFHNGWVSVLLDTFETVVFFVNSKNAYETRPFTNVSSISDFKSYVILLYNLVKSGHPSECISSVDLGALDLMVFVHIGWLNSMMSTHLMWSIFSLFYRDAWKSLYGIGQNSFEITYHSKPIWYLADFVESHSDGTETIFSTFYNYFGSGAWGFSSLRGFLKTTSIA